MRVFVTGATGFVGMPVVRELIAGGHEVVGLARSDEGVAVLEAIGAGVRRGSLDDLDGLRAGAREADAVIHLAFVHDWANFVASCETDRVAIEAMGEVLAGTGKVFVATGGLAGLAGPGELATEEDVIPADFPFPRVSEQTALRLAGRGVRVSVVRLSQIHDTHKQGLVTPIISVFRQKGACAYIGEGANVYSAAHVSDVARLYRLAVEKGAERAVYHGVAEEGVSMRAISEALGQSLRLPVKSVAPEEVEAFFGPFARFAGLDMLASSARTREILGWEPVGPGLIADLEGLEVS